MSDLELEYLIESCDNSKVVALLVLRLCSVLYGCVLRVACACCVLRVACCVLRVACRVLRVACCVLRRA
jgi:hypothetical protein